jgi:hypothetical protein
MPKYLFIGSYTAECARGVLKEGGTGRRAATEQLVTSLGGTGALAAARMSTMSKLT